MIYFNCHPIAYFKFYLPNSFYNIFDKNAPLLTLFSCPFLPLYLDQLV